MLPFYPFTLLPLYPPMLTIYPSTLLHVDHVIAILLPVYSVTRLPFYPSTRLPFHPFIFTLIPVYPSIIIPFSHPASACPIFYP